MTTQLTLGDALANEGIGRATQASDPDALAEVDRLIARYAATGEPFSANDTRGSLPEGIRPAAVGGRFRQAARSGLIRPVGYVASTDQRTHGHPVRVWQGVAR